MTIETVEQLVAHLKAHRELFYVTNSLGLLRTRCGEFHCPLMAAVPPAERLCHGWSHNGDAMDAAREVLAMPEDVAEAVIRAADNMHDHDPAVRAQLLTLVEVA